MERQIVAMVTGQGWKWKSEDDPYSSMGQPVVSFVAFDDNTITAVLMANDGSYEFHQDLGPGDSRVVLIPPS